MAVVMSGPMAGEDHHTAGVGGGASATGISPGLSNVYGCVCVYGCMRVAVGGRVRASSAPVVNQQRRADKDTFQTVWCNLRVRALSSTRPVLSALEPWSLEARTARAGDGQDVQWTWRASWTLTAMGSVQSVWAEDSLLCHSYGMRALAFQTRVLPGRASSSTTRQATSPNRHLGKRRINQVPEEVHISKQ